MYLHKRTPKRSNLRDFRGLYSSLLGQKPVWGQAFNFSVAIGSDFTFSWTPGVRQQAQWSRRRQAPQPWGGMQGGERNTSRGRKTLQKWNQLKKWKLFLMLSPVTSVTTNQPLRRDWSSTREWSTKHHSQRRAWGKVKRVPVSLSASLFLPIETYFVRCQHLTNRNLFCKMPAS